MSKSDIVQLTLGSMLLAILLAITGCQVTQSPFARTTGSAGAAFAAASLTLSYAHEGKVTPAYAASVFVNYQSELSNVDQQIASQTGKPDVHTVQHLLVLYRSAMQVIKQPCLDQACNWRAQVATLDRGSQAFLKAGGQ